MTRAKPKYHISSGSSIGKRRSKVVGCDRCNFMCNHAETYLPEGEKKKRKYKTGDVCPRCNCQTVRVFDSRAEFTYANELKVMQDKGMVEEIQYQVPYDLHAYNFETGEPVKVCTLVLDFVYFYNPDPSDPDSKFDIVLCDVKGGDDRKVVVTPEAKLKMQWLEKEYGVSIHVVGR